MVNDWENPQIQGRNREPARASLIPYATVNEALRRLKNQSTFYHLLDGEWRFFFAPNPDSAPKDFQLPDFSVAAWDTIQTPSNWQMQGYDIPYYTDVQLPFPPDDVPRVPADNNPTGCYRCVFEIPAEWNDRQIFLKFKPCYWRWRQRTYLLHQFLKQLIFHPSGRDQPSARLVPFNCC